MPAQHWSSSFRRPLLAVALLLVVTGTAPAQVVTSLWNGSSGNWTNPGLWSPAVPNNGTPPGTTYNATVNGTGTLAVNGDINIQTLDFSQGTINVQAGTFNINNGGSAGPVG